MVRTNNVYLSRNVDDRNCKTNGCPTDCITIHWRPQASGSVSDRIRELQENYEKQQKEQVATKQEPAQPCDCNGIDIKEECPTSVSGFDWEGYADEL